MSIILLAGAWYLRVSYHSGAGFPVLGYETDMSQICPKDFAASDEGLPYLRSRGFERSLARLGYFSEYGRTIRMSKTVSRR